MSTDLPPPVLMPPVLILGATSDIGRAIARRFAAAGHPLHLAARDPARLEGDAADCRIRSDVAVVPHRFDVLSDDAGALMRQLSPLPRIVVCVVGTLGRPGADTPAEAEMVMRTNYIGPALALEAAARLLQQNGGGIVVGISSVAGERGRAANYVYGSAKAGLTAYLSGLRASLHGAPVRVITVKPGFVDTRMTAGMPLPKLLTAQPDDVADAIAKAIAGTTDVVYVHPIWRLIMAAIRALPEPVFKRVRI